MTACRTKGLKLASLRGVNRSLSAVLSQAVEDAILPANPAFRMGKHLRAGDELPTEIKPLTRDEVQTLLGTADHMYPDYAPLFLCAVRTGMRLGELVALQWSDIEFHRRCIHVRRSRVAGKMTTTKNKQQRRLDMSVLLTQTLTLLRAARKRAALTEGKADRRGSARSACTTSGTRMRVSSSSRGSRSPMSNSSSATPVCRSRWMSTDT